MLHGVSWHYFRCRKREGASQALLIHDLDDRPDALGVQLGSRNTRQRAISQEQCLVVRPRQLCGFANGERPHSDGDRDGRCPASGHGWAR